MMLPRSEHGNISLICEALWCARIAREKPTRGNPVKIGGYISLHATGEGQTSPAGIDGSVVTSTPVRPILPITATIDGIPAPVQYAGGVPGQVVGLMQVNLQIPDGVQPGGLRARGSAGWEHFHNNGSGVDRSREVKRYWTQSARVITGTLCGSPWAQTDHGV